ncbi:hypothetical protein L1987_00062 [Smallanthus sonchifolius]|uniref:Uncharacterized protein n=1 Tax=Smallanthus sonchifolius TaxID=185202 RepID=A0ACB9K138_9ASTR|nr:hypothetical protein L1987_00062 [Smallanthus sonchifolius]
MWTHPLRQVSVGCGFILPIVTYIRRYMLVVISIRLKCAKKGLLLRCKGENVAKVRRFERALIRNWGTKVAKVTKSKVGYD